MKKVLKLLLLIISILFISACNTKVSLSKPTNLAINETGLVTWDKVEHATTYVISVNGTEYSISTPFYLLNDLTKDAVITVKAQALNIEDSEVSDNLVYKAPTITPPKPIELDIKIGISGSSEIKCGKSIQLSANVTGGKTNEHTWEVIDGKEYVSIDQNGLLVANEEALNIKDVVVKVKVTSKENPKVSTIKAITVLSKPTLTNEMLDAIKNEKFLSFEGFLNISIYPMGSKKVTNTYYTPVKTALDSEYWYAEFENNSAMVKQSIFYKNHEGFACQVGVNFLNQEEYNFALDDMGNPISWDEYGLYNNFKDLTIDDFTFDEETWRYTYKKQNETDKLDERMIASMNPYNFLADGFSLILEEDEIIGVYAKSREDYTIVEQMVAIQELFVAINKGEENVEVKKVPRYEYNEEVHKPLKNALDKMHNATSLTSKFLNTQASVMTSSVTEDYSIEYITETDCYFEPYTIKYIGSLEPTYVLKDDTYGFKKINDNLYNSYYRIYNELKEPIGYQAARAFSGDFKNAKPTFAFAPEIFNTYYVDEEEGTTTYYVDEIMSGVASTFYYGVGNDINLYGIYATRGYISTTESFTPYVVVDNETEEIKSAAFYYYLGYLYGVIEVEFENYNSTVLPVDEINFDVRYAPTSWDELTIIVTGTDTNTNNDKELNAKEVLLDYFGVKEEESTEFLEKMPFFGDALGDTYGFGMTQPHIDSNRVSNQAIQFYYDVPLDINYSIESSIKKVEDYLIALGFTRNKYGEFNKDNIWVHPLDKDLDLMIYVWKERKGENNEK